MTAKPQDIGPGGETLPKKGAEKSGGIGILYQVEDTPPWLITILYVIQNTVLTAPDNVVICTLVHTAVCGGKDYGFLAELVAIAMITTGIGTVLQITVGIRLPVIQGIAYSFIPPLYAAMASDKYKCPEENVNFTHIFNTTDNNELPEWNPRIRVVSGSLMVAAAIQVVLGLTGVFGLLLPYIGPLTIAPAVSLIGLSLYPAVISSSQPQWGIAILTVTIMVIFAIGLRDVGVPLPTFRKGKGLVCGEKYNLFRLFPSPELAGKTTSHRQMESRKWRLQSIPN